MVTSLEAPVAYALPLGGARVPMNERLGQSIRIEFAGAINCIACERSIKKTFNGGYCFPCARSLPEADSCIVKPETCHFAAGTCRDPAWGEAQCMQPHTVYLANSSGLKVGITRGLEPIGRWIDQGACQGLAIRHARTRLESGQIEVALREFVSDRTDWRRMLKGAPEPVDLAQHRDRLLALYEEKNPGAPLFGKPAPSGSEVAIQYPVLEYPEKVRAHNLDKEPVLEGTLLGIKGQYLILDTKVLNVRKYAGYHLALG
jgi:hypothetical protein